MRAVTSARTLVDMPNDGDLVALASLIDGQRRRVFEQIQAAAECTVSEIAASLSIGRTLVTFHLAKLVEAGLRVGISSTSHDAVINVLHGIDRYRTERAEAGRDRGL